MNTATWIAVLICLFASRLDGTPPLTARPHVERVADGAYAVMGLYHPQGSVNAAFIVTPRSIVFVDAGMTADDGRAVWREATRRYPRRRQIFLVLTHFHCDHTFGMGYFKTRGAVVIGHRAIRPWLDQAAFAADLERRSGRRLTFPQVMALENFGTTDVRRTVLGNVQLSPPDRLLAADDVLTVDGRTLDLLHVPGHSSDQIAVFDRRTGVLVAGDSVYTARDPYLHDEPPEAYQTWIDSLATLRRLPIGRIVPGHGPIAGIAAIDANIRALRARVGQLHVER
jgi:glyoxylase-like metal-dependent hydrolase (beta-lactamase superfamily II)